LAEPMGLVVASSAANAFEYIGMPEGIYPIVEATLFLSTAPKSNSATQFFAVKQEIEDHGTGAVPTPLMDTSRDSKGFGHGQGYEYPHNFPGHFTGQQYLPDKLIGRHFYQPSDQGYEGKMAEWLKKWREAQEKALAEKTANLNLLNTEKE
jgi:putative ATPase